MSAADRTWVDRNSAAYELIARSYAGDAPAEDDPALRAACRELFASRLSGPRVLEVGCGPGVDAFHLAARGLDVLATDSCQEFLAIVRERFPELRTARLDLTRPEGLPAASFDGIYGFACFLHVPRALAGEALAGLARLLAPGGVLFLSLARSTRVAGYVLPDWGGVPGNEVLFTCYGEEEITALLEQAGLGSIERFRLSAPVYERMPRLIEREVSLYQVLARRR